MCSVARLTLSSSRRGIRASPVRRLSPPEEVDADLFVVGPEQPLVDGLADRLRARGALVFGPGEDGARLEGSKAWMKRALAEANVPTARFAAFDDSQEADAISFLRDLPGFYVVKTDGLAAGKGVFVTESLTEAIEDVRAKLSGASFGAAGTRVVIEEGLTGPELSLLCVCDGERIVPLAPAQRLQASRRWRRRSEHRRHGSVLAGSRRGRRPRRADPRDDRRADRRLAPAQRHRLPGRPLRGAHAHTRRSKGDRVQRPLRRSGGTGRAAPHCERPHGPARRGSRGTNPLACRLQSRSRGDGGVRDGGVSHSLSDQATSSKDSTGFAMQRMCTCTSRESRRTATVVSSRREVACSM